jgi:nicotinate-nucleotide adenylyltransferase
MNTGGNGPTPACGIFGGTFDPVHFDHLRAATEVKEKLRLEDFRLLPAGNPPLRSTTFATAEHRLAMLRLALSDCPDLAVDDREVRRAGLSYMVDTLSGIRAEEGDIPLLLIIGQDAANALDQWHEWRRLFELAHLVIMRRPQSAHAYSDELLEQVKPRQVSNPRDLSDAPAGLVLPLELTQLAISSTDIRRRLRSGLSPRFLMPQLVIDYIRENNLYGHGNANS